MNDRHSPLLRDGGKLLAALMMTPDAGLETFGKRRIFKEDVTAEQLMAARTILDALSFVLRSDSVKDWGSMMRAAHELSEVEVPELPPPAERGPAVIPKALEQDPIEAIEARAAADAKGSQPEADGDDEEAAPEPSPVAAAPAAVPPTPVQSPAPVHPSPAVLATPAPAGGASPWAAAGEAPAPAPAAPPTAASASGGDAMGSTVGVGAISPLAGMVLPFAGGQKKASDAAPQTSGGLPFQQSEAAPPPSPAAPSTGGVPELSLDQYAAMCALCEMYPDTVDANLARYGVSSPEIRAQLDGAWRQKLADPALQQQFQAAYERCQEWYRTHPQR